MVTLFPFKGNPITGIGAFGRDEPVSRHSKRAQEPELVLISPEFWGGSRTSAREGKFEGKQISMHDGRKSGFLIAVYLYTPLLEK